MCTYIIYIYTSRQMRQWQQCEFHTSFGSFQMVKCRNKIHCFRGSVEKKNKSTVRFTIYNICDGNMRCKMFRTKYKMLPTIYTAGMQYIYIYIIHIGYSDPQLTRAHRCRRHTKIIGFRLWRIRCRKCSFPFVRRRRVGFS